MKEEIRQEAKLILEKLGPAIYNLVDLKNKSNGQYPNPFQMIVDATMHDIIKTILFETGHHFNVDSGIKNNQ